MTVTEENELELHDVVEEVNMSLLYFKAFFTSVSSKNLFALPFHQHFTLNIQLLPLKTKLDFDFI